MRRTRAVAAAAVRAPLIGRPRRPALFGHRRCSFPSRPSPSSTAPSPVLPPSTKKSKSSSIPYVPFLSVHFYITHLDSFCRTRRCGSSWKKPKLPSVRGGLREWKTKILRRTVPASMISRVCSFLFAFPRSALNYRVIFNAFSYGAVDE